MEHIVPRALNKSEVAERKEAATREIDSNPLYIQLAEKYENEVFSHQQTKEQLEISKRRETASFVVLSEITNKEIYDGNLSRYQEKATCYANTNLPPRERLAVAALGLVGEAAEASELIKKHIGHNHELNVEKLTLELGDVLWYLADLANIIGVDLKEVASKNLDKLKARYPDGVFNAEHSKNRTP